MAKPKLSPQQQAQVLAQRIQAQVVRAAGKGLMAAAIFLAARVKETMSEPAPRKRTPGGGYRATTRATPGAPIRKLSGRARGSVFRRQISDTQVAVGTNAKSDKGFNYPKYHERPMRGQSGSGKHRFIAPTVRQYRAELARIIGRVTTVEMR